MKNLKHLLFGTLPILTLITAAFFLSYSPLAHAKAAVLAIAQKDGENKIRHLIEPLLDKYCHDQCKLMNINVSLDIARQDSISPGFDDSENFKNDDVEPASAKMKILIDDKVGPISRGKLLDLMQEYLDTLDFPVKIEAQIAHFPMPQGSEGKVADMRQRISKQFLSVTEDLLRQFCPQHCMLADFDLKTDVVNAEESQYGAPGEFVQDGDTAIKIRDISATILMDEALTKEEQDNLLQIAKLKTNSFKNVSLIGKSLKFPRPVPIAPHRALASDGSVINSDGITGLGNSINENKKLSESNNSTSADNKIENNTLKSNESNVKQEKFEHFEKIERVENGDAVQAELQKFKVFGVIFAASIMAMFIFIAMSIFKPGSLTKNTGSIQRVFQTLTSDPASISPSSIRPIEAPPPTRVENTQSLMKRYESERLIDELVSIYAQQPRVAKHVFSKVLTEEGVEVAANCVQLFGESIVVDMLRDPSLQSDINELMEYYSKNPIEMDDDEKYELLRKLHNRTVAGKLAIIGSRSSQIFDFLAEMDEMQISELVRTESLTVKAIVLTQCDPQKRSNIYAQLDSDIRMQLLTELSRVDHLPRDYIFNVASALKRKRQENPKLNTEALPGSEVLVSLLERTGHDMQKTVVRSLEMSNPDSARVVKNKLVSIDTLKYLRDGQLLEVVLSLKHEELIQFLKGTAQTVKSAIFSKSPKELSLELEDELGQAGAVSREAYLAIERKLINRMKIMSNEGQINLVETNERMFTDTRDESGGFVDTSPISTGRRSSPRVA